MTRPLVFLRLVLALLLPALFAGPARAQLVGAPEREFEGKPIRDIVFVGLRRASQSYFREQIRLKVGDLYTREALNDDVKRLYNSGKVDGEVKADPLPVAGGVKIVFEIRELEEVREVEYEGLSSVSERELRDSPEGMRIRAAKDEKPGTTFEEYRARLDQETIIRMLKEKGKLWAEVDVERVERPDGLKVIFHVREGPTLRVGEIRFVGNDHLAEDELRRHMKTQTTVLYFIRSGYFDRPALDEDLKNVERAYWREGYLDVRAMTEDISFSADRSRARITIRVIEGDRYTVRRVEVTGVTLFEPKWMRDQLETRDGEYFSGEKLAKDMEKIEHLYNDKGYIFNRVDFRRRVAEGARAIDLSFIVEEGVKVTLERVRFEGNVRTRDDVVRRELSVFPGEPFNATDMDESKDRLGRRGYFKDLRVTFEPGTAPDRRDLDVHVEEQETGQIMFGGGISTSTGLFGRIVFVQRNFDIKDVPGSWDDIASGHFFVGGGQTLLLEAEPGQLFSRYTATFVEPYLLPDEIPFPIQLRTSFSYYDSAIALSYFEQRLEPQVGLGYRLTRDSLIEVAYRFTDSTIYHVDPFAPADVVRVAGQNHVSAVDLSFNVDRNQRDLNLTNYGGWGAGALVEGAGGPFGGDWDFVKVEVNANAQTTLFHWPGDSKHVIGGRILAGWMTEYGNSDQVPVFERLYAGGPHSVRGFQFRSVGPVDNDVPIGGDVRVVGSVEYTFPIIPGFDQTYAPEWRADFLRGALFCDVGNVEPDLDRFYFDDFRIAVGFGVRIKIPIFPAPLALDFGFPVRKLDSDRPEIFSFSIGTGLPY